MNTKGGPKMRQIATREVPQTSQNRGEGLQEFWPSSKKTPEKQRHTLAACAFATWGCGWAAVQSGLKLKGKL